MYTLPDAAYDKAGKDFFEKASRINVSDTEQDLSGYTVQIVSVNFQVRYSTFPTFPAYKPPEIPDDSGNFFMPHIRPFSPVVLLHQQKRRWEGCRTQTLFQNHQAWPRTHGMAGGGYAGIPWTCAQGRHQRIADRLIPIHCVGRHWQSTIADVSGTPSERVCGASTTHCQENFT